eukprot:CAMPEP_0203747020 /NCGR_PEP_ID=MMETSP0098-20131031/2277_1 /ASSEMBLY_ACC=CAM_ASM_000208 /TAXON_ID=96639 /ORGANISM=" , Strain NY0313808BC1" /LENGTH=368 /DNA_ID=CAMNT_0050635303 /DNA_START=254 /DNA_END=1360 /DNA_ORIENTATION=+
MVGKSDGSTCVLLYYCYQDIDSVETLVDDQKKLCETLGVNGRIRIASEGINGTIGGTKEQLDSYIEETSKRLNRNDIDWKVSTLGEYEEQPFDDLIVKNVSNLVGWNTSEKYKLSNTATHLAPQDFHEIIVQHESAGSKDEIALIDVRNTYEYDVGHFDGAINPETRKFSDFEDWFRQSGAKLVKDKKSVLMYCTGGIRCEKASAAVREILEEENGNADIPDLYQLKGGIHRYLENFGPKGKFLGRNFVFDKRVMQPLGTEEEKDVVVVGRCTYCDVKWDKVLDERRCKKCRMLVLCCDSCMDPVQGLWCVKHSYLDPRKTSLCILEAKRQALDDAMKESKPRSNRRKALKRQIREIDDKLVGYQTEV